MGAIEYYVLTLAVYAALNGILVLGLNIHFGTTGILNFAYISLVAVGAYATGIASLPPAKQQYLTQYVGGFGWDFPWSMLFGTACAVLFALLLGAVAFLRLREDYLALTLFTFGAGLWTLVDNYQPIFNGVTGLNSVNGPGQLTLDASTYQFAFLGIAVVALALIFILFQRLDHAPLGRAWRAMRDDEVAAASLGKSPYRIRMKAFLLGALAAGLGGSLFILYVGGWSPNGWQPAENLILLAAVIVGGRGRNLGVIFGSLLFMEGIVEASRFLPTIADRPDLVGDLQGILIGTIFLAFVWWRPQGIFPERREKFARTRAPVTQPSEVVHRAAS